MVNVIENLPVIVFLLVFLIRVRVYSHAFTIARYKTCESHSVFWVLDHRGNISPC